MKCKYCGTEMGRGIDVCPKCGRIHNNLFGNKKNIGIIAAITAAVILSVAGIVFAVVDNNNGMDVKVINEAEGEYMLINAPADLSFDVSLNNKENTPEFTVKDYYGTKTDSTLKISGNKVVIMPPEDGYKEGVVYTIDVSKYGTFNNKGFEGASDITFIAGNGANDTNSDVLNYKADIYELDKEVVAIKEDEIILEGEFKDGDIVVTDSDKNGIKESYKLIDPVLDTDLTSARYTNPDIDELYDNRLVLKNINVEDTYYKYKDAIYSVFFKATYYDLINGQSLSKEIHDYDIYFDDKEVDALDGYITAEISEGKHTLQLKWEYENQKFNFEKEVEIIDEIKTMEDIDFSLLYEYFKAYFSDIDICTLNDADEDGCKEMFIHQEYGGTNPIDAFFDCGGLYVFDDYGDAKMFYHAPTGAAASAHLKKYEDKIILNETYSTAGTHLNNYYYWETYGIERFASQYGTMVGDYETDMEYDCKWEDQSIGKDEFNRNTEQFTDVQDESEKILTPVIDNDDPEKLSTLIEKIFSFRGSIAESIHLNIDEDSYDETLLILHDHAGRWIRESNIYETIGSGEPYSSDWIDTSGTIVLLINPDNGEIKAHPKFLGDLEYEFVDVSSNGNIIELPIKNSGAIIKLEVTSDGIEYVY